MQQDLARENKRIPLEELKARLGEARFKQRVEPYLFEPQARVDYESALAMALSKETQREVKENFYNGGGKKLSYGPDTKLSNQLKEHSRFQEYFQTYLNFMRRFTKDRSFANRGNDEFEQIKRMEFSNLIEIPKYDFYGLGLKKQEWSLR